MHHLLNFIHRYFIRLRNKSISNFLHVCSACKFTFTSIDSPHILNPRFNENSNTHMQRIFTHLNQNFFYISMNVVANNSQNTHAKFLVWPPLNKSMSAFAVNTNACSMWYLVFIFSYFYRFTKLWYLCAHVVRCCIEDAK